MRNEHKVKAAEQLRTFLRAGHASQSIHPFVCFTGTLNCPWLLLLSTKFSCCCIPLCSIYQVVDNFLISYKCCTIGNIFQRRSHYSSTLLAGCNHAELPPSGNAQCCISARDHWFSNMQSQQHIFMSTNFISNSVD